MSFSYPGSTNIHVLYQADPGAVQSLRAIRERVEHVCRHHANKMVRVQTMDGHVYEGVIVGCQSGMLYLSVKDTGHDRNLLSSYYYNTVILPLVLYELLVITLMIL